MYVGLCEWVFTLKERNGAFGEGGQTRVGSTWQGAVMWWTLWEP